MSELRERTVQQITQELVCHRLANPEEPRRSRVIGHDPVSKLEFGYTGLEADVILELAGEEHRIDVLDDYGFPTMPASVQAVSRCVARWIRQHPDLP